MGVVPQKVQLSALRKVLSRVATQPDAWLHGYHAALRGCHNSGVSRVFTKTYRKKVNGRTAWLVHVLVRIACSEEAALRYLELHCREGQLYSRDGPIDIIMDSLGRFCVSSAVSMPRPPASRSFIGVQSGILGISFYESNYEGAAGGKQAAIDDLTSRLRKASEQQPPSPSSES